LQYPLGGRQYQNRLHRRDVAASLQQHDSGALQRAEAARRNGETRLLPSSGRPTPE